MRLKIASLSIKRIGFLVIAALLLLESVLFPIQAAAGERTLYYHNDAVGSPVVMTDSSGNVVWRADYKPFGDEWLLNETPPDKNTHRFIGKEVDSETDLHYFGARYYDAELGRFLSIDPRPSFASIRTLNNPQRSNLYVYSLNNPYRFVDPDGEKVILASRYVTGSLRLGQHAFVVVEPSDPSSLPPRYRSRSRITLSGFPEDGKLVKKEDDPSDNIDTALHKWEITPPPGMTEGEFDSLVLNRFLSYQNDLPYALFPVNGGGYNSNSLAASLVFGGGNVPTASELNGSNPGFLERFKFPYDLKVKPLSSDIAIPWGKPVFYPFVSARD